jgi:cell division protein FtsX
MLGRILANTKKQIFRSGWIGWASVSVMVLAFLVGIIFGGLAYVSNLYIQFIEHKSNLLVFFAEGMDQQITDELWGKWKEIPEIKDIGYTSEEKAYLDYSDYTERVQPEIYAVLKTKEEQILPSSLDIQIWSLDDLESVKTILQRDIEAELKELEITSLEGESEMSPVSFPTESEVVSMPKYKYSVDNPYEPPIRLEVDDESLDQLRQVLFTLRVAGIFVITLLFIVIVFFTFMTVEFRLFNQMEEIGVMQLVGGSLFFIRAPYILEGGFYGFLGALVASLILAGILIAVFVLNSDSAVTLFFYENFNNLPWPSISEIGWVFVIALLSFGGFVLGSVSSFLAIRRYIR